MAKNSLQLEPNGCIKTGFNGYIKPYGMFVHGDLFKYDDIIVARICSREYTMPEGMKIHANFINYHHWFDEDSTSTNRNSTIIAHINQVRLFTYDGVTLTREVMEK